MELRQGELFPVEGENLTDPDIPEHILHDFKVISGELEPTAPIEQGKEEPFVPLPGSAQERFLDARTKRETKVEIEESDVYALDLATPEGRDKYKEIMDTVIPKVLSNPTQWKFTETAAQVMLDPNSAVGYRAITVIRCWKQKVTEVKLDHGYTVLK